MAATAEALYLLGEPPETGGHEPGTIDLSDPRLNEGIFVDGQAPDETARNYVVDQEPRAADKSRHGQTNLEIYTMQNGRQYEVISGEPKRQRSDTPVIFTTALGTSVRGHNWHTMYKVMDLGYPVVLIGPEGGHANWPKSPASLKRFLRNLASIDIEETAGNMHEILDATDESGLYEPGEFIAIGESRASAVGMGVAARAHRYGRQMLYGDFIAPPFPKTLSDARGRLALPGQLVTQTSLLGNIPLKMSPGRALHFPRTINPNPHFLLHMAATIPTLLSGRTGELAGEIHPDSKIHNTIFTGDAWSDGEGWEEVFEGHPYVVNTHLPGNHMAIAKPDTQRARLDRLTGLREELAAAGGDRSSIDWSRVHMAVHLAVAA